MIKSYEDMYKILKKGTLDVNDMMELLRATEEESTIAINNINYCLKRDGYEVKEGYVDAELWGELYRS